MVEARLIERLSSAPAPDLAVVGDLILDRFVWGAVDRISPEAPIQVLAADSEEDRLGGAANVARNAHHLGARVFCAGVVGDDPEGQSIRTLLTVEKLGRGLVTDTSRPTTIKTRMLAHSQQVLRVDRERVNPVSKSIGRKLVTTIRDRQKLDGIMTNIHQATWEMAAEYGQAGNYVAGANIAGFIKVARAMVALGLI